MDSHNVQRCVTNEGFVKNEGDVGVSPLRPYQIALGSLTPKEPERTNLVVPICISSSHIAYGCIRTEPVFMILGQSVAAVAALAIDGNGCVQGGLWAVAGRTACGWPGPESISHVVFLP